MKSRLASGAFCYFEIFISSRVDILTSTMDVPLVFNSLFMTGSFLL